LGHSAEFVVACSAGLIFGIGLIIEFAMNPKVLGSPTNTTPSATLPKPMLAALLPL
jgi:hypothetical protein